MLTLKIGDKGVITKTIEILKSGGLIIFPTETCYGVGVDATNQSAVNKLLEYKERPEGKAISIGVCDEAMASIYVDINSVASKVYRNFLPGPVTVISQSKNRVAKGLSSERNTLGVRIPDYKLIREIIKEFGKPITMTSANLSGRKTPYELEDVLNNISDKSKSLIDLIVDSGKLPPNPPSSVLDTTNEGVVSIREGSIDFSKKVETYDVTSVEEMRKLGESFVKEGKKDKAVVILFNAEMGAGKTQFVKGVGVGLGISEIIKSPTYTLLCEYEYMGGRLIHMDAWRMEGELEFRDLIEESFFDRGNVIAIEWAGSLSKWILEIQKKDVDIFVINIEYDGESKRKVWIQKIK